VWKLQAPVKAGDVIVADILGTGVDIIASRNMAAKN
jgi:CxxC motif-containing protein